MIYNTTFYIQVYRDGNQIPIIHIESNLLERIKELSHLGRGHMSRSEGVRRELDSIKTVLNGEKEVHSFGGDEWCIVDFKKDKSTIINFFDEFELFEIDSNIIVELLQEWYEFLIAWENNDIPGIIHPSKREAK